MSYDSNFFIEKNDSIMAFNLKTMLRYCPAHPSDRYRPRPICLNNQFFFLISNHRTHHWQYVYECTVRWWTCRRSTPLSPLVGVENLVSLSTQTGTLRCTLPRVPYKCTRRDTPLPWFFTPPPVVSFISYIMWRTSVKCARCVPEEKSGLNKEKKM